MHIVAHAYPLDFHTPTPAVLAATNESANYRHIFLKYPLTSAFEMRYNFNCEVQLHDDYSISATLCQHLQAQIVKLIFTIKGDDSDGIANLHRAAGHWDKHPGCVETQQSRCNAELVNRR